MEGIPLSWARDVLKFSLSATALSSYPFLDDVVASSSGLSAADDIDLDDPGKDPKFRKLVEAVLFSRRLMWSYNAVLVGVLVAFTVWHWGEKALWVKRKRRVEKAFGVREVGDEAWSSSSSTISGTATPLDAKKKSNTAGEETVPLLPRRRPRQKIGSLKCWMQYQPPKIPVINKTLPPNSVSFLILSFIALNIYFNLYRMPLDPKYLFVFADRCGIIFVANLPLLYLLAAKNQPIQFLTGYSYESLNIFHRRLGELICLEALLHFLGMLGVWYGLLRHLGFSLVRFLLNRLVGLGIGAFVAYEVLYFTSLGSFRQRCYEIFLALHVFLQLAGLSLLWFHHHTSRPYVGIPMAIFLIDRLLFRLWLKTSSHPATLTILGDNETILLSSNWDISASASPLLPKSMKQGWWPNDHIFLTIPSLSHKHILQAHPFTIFSAAPTTDQGKPPSDSDSESAHAWFSLLIRPQSGFTSTLLSHARLQPKTRVRLDGPYGSSHAFDILSTSNTAIIVAGGSGIAVAYPLLWALLNPSASPADIERGRSLETGGSRNVKLLWIIHSPSHRTWVPEDKMQELRSWGLEMLLPPPTSEAGRPDVRDILQGWTDRRTGVVVSGPNGLVRDVRNSCARLVGEGESIKVQVEKFGW
ncbi:ferric reductase transmembrane component [Lindgomyces ingoldianus]|uniref:Ferric reductase transmembrane component n=1 Tax=Lindgomyces ingoldianus TaxID=673940 RepID=A0ACB6R1J3_9PLEO|nr:ferric reductase transmembrane component [Lindgomyces ingoldianus]KAF2473148.1 ferric reductase transmembrane component [Lindgomyces ingoldianus]